MTVKRVLFFSIAALTALALAAGPVMAEGMGELLSDREMGGVFAGDTEGSGGKPPPRPDYAPGVQLTDNAQMNASSLVLQNLNNSSSIVQINMAISGNGNVTQIAPKNVVVGSQN